VHERTGLLDVFLDRRGVDPSGCLLGDAVRAVAHTAPRDREDPDDAVQDRFGVRCRRGTLAVQHVLRDVVPVEEFGVDLGGLEGLALSQRHTPRDHQVRGRLLVEFAGPGEHVALGLLEDRTGVEDGHVRGLGTGGRPVASVPECPLYLAGLTPVGGAPVGLDVVPGHTRASRSAGKNATNRDEYRRPVRDGPPVGLLRRR